MIHPENILKALFETFDQSARTSFQTFLTCNAGVTKWFISADYCLHDSTRPSNVFAFSVIPYNDHFDQLKADIRAGLPKDLKQTKAISAAAKRLLCDPMRFHFAFLLKSPPKIFYDGDGSKPIDLARACIDRTLVEMVAHGRSSETLELIKRLKREAQARSFNLKLLADMFLLSHLFSFVTLALARDNPASVIGWMSDRDKMTDAFGGVLWVIANENVLGLAERFGVIIPDKSPNIAVPTPPAAVDAAAIGEVATVPGEAAQAETQAAPTENPMWFDEFIRIPDYIAGALAAWDLHSNILPPSHPKYVELAEDVIATANNMAVITLRYTHEFQSARMVFAKIPPPKRPYNHRSGKSWR
jgi:hypothetical protein